MEISLSGLQIKGHLILAERFSEAQTCIPSEQWTLLWFIHDLDLSSVSGDSMEYGRKLIICKLALEQTA